MPVVVVVVVAVTIGVVIAVVVQRDKKKEQEKRREHDFREGVYEAAIDGFATAHRSDWKPSQGTNKTEDRGGVGDADGGDCGVDCGCFD
jgi:hypothetical protein